MAAASKVIDFTNTGVGGSQEAGQIGLHSFRFWPQSGQ
jgi:hypothetical protein